MAENNNVNNKSNANNGSGGISRNNAGRRNNHGGRPHHRSGNNSNNTDNITKFTLGNCESEGKKYEFRYDNGTYKIVLLKEEEQFDVVLTTKDKEEAYPEWNKLKRPDKKSK
ncbi:MAG: hypothetical protein J6A69_06345 [Clostridia bacterium]|nr:hypothetical protein [Clostridia bacterium]